MEMVMMSTIENLNTMFAMWTAFMAVVFLAVAPERETVHRIVDLIYDTGESILAMAGRMIVESMVLLGCGLVIADAVMANAIEGDIDKSGEAKAWVVEG